MVRFLHTADIQLGMRATDVPAVAAAIREQRFLALERVVGLAKDESVDFILIAGDLFEHSQISGETAYRAARILGSAAAIPVYVLPGNHDPLSADSVYHREAFGERCPKNLVILEGRESVILPNCQCVLCPCPVRERRSSFDPTMGWQGRLPEATVKVGVAHGSLAIEGMHSGDDHPIGLEAAERLGVDYLALGHWHSYFLHGTRTAYPGTPEPTTFGEKDSGSACLVSIAAPGAPPSIERRRVGQLQWLQWEIGLPDQSLDEVRHRVGALTSPEKTLLRVVLRGTVDTGTVLAFDDLEAWLRVQGLLYVELRREVVAAQALMSALARLAEEDPVLAGVVADLQKLISLDAEPSAVVGEAMATSRPVEELLALWGAARGEDVVDRAAVATEAIAELALLAQEVAR
jgi:DNA repair exonuclease SbcCD nuclease subunit